MYRPRLYMSGLMIAVWRQILVHSRLKKQRQVELPSYSKDGVLTVHDCRPPSYPWRGACHTIILHAVPMVAYMPAACLLAAP